MMRGTWKECLHTLRSRNPTPHQVVCTREGIRVQVPNGHIFTQILYYNDYYPKPKYLIIGYLDPLGEVIRAKGSGGSD